MLLTYLSSRLRKERDSIPSIILCALGVGSTEVLTFITWELVVDFLHLFLTETVAL